MVKRRARDLVERWGIQIVVYVAMWILLLVTILVSAIIVGPRACVAPEPEVHRDFDRRS